MNNTIERKKRIIELRGRVSYVMTSKELHQFYEEDGVLVDNLSYRKENQEFQIPRFPIMIAEGESFIIVGDFNKKEYNCKNGVARTALKQREK